MFCGNCGTKNEDGATICKQCGASLTQDVPTTTTPPAGAASSVIPDQVRNLIPSSIQDPDSILYLISLVAQLGVLFLWMRRTVFYDVYGTVSFTTSNYLNAFHKLPLGLVSEFLLIASIFCCGLALTRIVKDKFRPFLLIPCIAASGWALLMIVIFTFVDALGRFGTDGGPTLLGWLIIPVILASIAIAIIAIVLPFIQKAKK